MSRSSGMGAPWKIWSPNGVKPSNPRSVDNGGFVKGVPWACRKCCRLCSRRRSSMSAASLTRTHCRWSCLSGMSKWVRPPGVEGLRAAQTSAKHRRVSSACLSPKIRLFRLLSFAARASRSKSSRYCCRLACALRWIARISHWARRSRMDTVSGGSRGAKSVPSRSMISWRAWA